MIPKKSVKEEERLNREVCTGGLGEVARYTVLIAFNAKNFDEAVEEANNLKSRLAKNRKPTVKSVREKY